MQTFISMDGRGDTPQTDCQPINIGDIQAFVLMLAATVTF